VYAHFITILSCISPNDIFAKSILHFSPDVVRRTANYALI
jgi:hypothetical protein